jgi:hypothetical protein
MRRSGKLKPATSNPIGVEVASVVVVVLTQMETVIGGSGEQRTRRRGLGRGAIVDEAIVEFRRMLGMFCPWCCTVNSDYCPIHTNDEHVVACRLFKALWVMKNHLRRLLNTSVSEKMMRRRPPVKQDQPTLPRRWMLRKDSLSFYIFLCCISLWEICCSEKQGPPSGAISFFPCILTKSQSL